jgi:hypothetical protein
LYKEMEKLNKRKWKNDLGEDTNDI